ncbi:hypothetical protein RI367_008164 [Sorochytrium milnesiophthora]
MSHLTRGGPSPLDIYELRMLIVSQATPDTWVNLALTSKSWHDLVARHLQSRWRTVHRRCKSAVSLASDRDGRAPSHDDMRQTSAVLPPLRTFLLDNYLWGNGFRQLTTYDLLALLDVVAYFCRFTSGKGIVNILMLMLTGMAEAQRSGLLQLTVDQLQQTGATEVPLATLLDLLEIVTQLFSYYGSLMHSRDQALLIRMWKAAASGKAVDNIVKELQTVRTSKLAAQESAATALSTRDAFRTEHTTSTTGLPADSVVEQVD